MQGVAIAKRKSNILDTLSLEKGSYILVTSHRPATVDVKENLETVLSAINSIAEEYDKRIIFPAHPRTKKMIEKFKIKLSDKYKIIDPVGYLDMITLQKESFLIVTDSGGLQEESCILQKKCVVIRENTERPEAVEVGGCVLVGNSDEKRILESTRKLVDREVDWYNPFGDGTAGEQIVEIFVDKLG